MPNDPTEHLPDRIERGIVPDWAKQQLPEMMGSYLPRFLADYINAAPDHYKRQALAVVDYIITLLHDTRELIEK